jgi:hypothetical protein
MASTPLIQSAAVNPAAAAAPHAAAACIFPDRKLLLVVRHGQAISNYLGDTLGPDEWYAVEGTCQYDDQKGTIYNIFDAGRLSHIGFK